LKRGSVGRRPAALQAPQGFDVIDVGRGSERGALGSLGAESVAELTDGLPSVKTIVASAGWPSVGRDHVERYENETLAFRDR
jgi:hypothetical protein